jgi:hypothetical protein
VAFDDKTRTPLECWTNPLNGETGVMIANRVCLLVATLLATAIAIPDAAHAKRRPKASDHYDLGRGRSVFGCHATHSCSHGRTGDSGPTRAAAKNPNTATALQPGTGATRDDCARASQQARDNPSSRTYELLGECMRNKKG